MITVMIVDDEPLVRSSIRFALEEIRFKTSIVGEAENGEDAIKCYESLLPDVVITDVKMPGMNGLEFIEEVRKTDRITQFIVISGYAEFKYAQQAMKHGITNYVLKPIKSSDLEVALKQCAMRLEVKYADILPKSDQLVNYIDRNFASPLTLDMLAEKFNFSPKYVSSMIKNRVGQSFTDYMISLRIKKAVELVTKTDQNMKDIATSVGYEDQQYFHRIFKKKTGKTPSQFRKD